MRGDVNGSDSIRQIRWHSAGTHLIPVWKARDVGLLWC